jgi:hypothetical protein
MAGQAGNGIPITTYKQPALGVAPRFGMAYDVTGRQKFVLRGGGGLYFDRPSGNAVFTQVLNPPARRTVTVRFGQLQSLSTGGLATESPSSLSVYEFDSPLPSSFQWNGGVQLALPWSTTVDVEYVGQHGYNIVRRSVSTTRLWRGVPAAESGSRSADDPGATSISSDQMRAYRGTAHQPERQPWMGHHHRCRSRSTAVHAGLSFGFNDTIGLSSVGSTGARLQHNADGSTTYRSDQAQADDLFRRRRSATS